MEEKYLAHHGIMGQKKGRRRYQNPDGSLTPLGRQRYGVGKERTPLLEGPTASSGSSNKSSKGSKSSSKKDDFIDAESWTEVKDDKSSSGSSKSSKRRFSRKTKVDDVMDGDWRKVEENVKKKAGKTKVDDVMDGKWKKVEEPKRNYEAISGALGAGSKFAGSLKSSQEKKLQKDKAKVMKAMDLSKFSDKELKDAISRMSAEDTYKRMTADRVEYGRQKTIRRLETIGSLAATASSAVGLYAAIKKVRS